MKRFSIGGDNPNRGGKPLMKFARPAIGEIIERLEGMDQDDSEVKELLERAKNWRPFAVGIPKEEVKSIRQEAGNLIYDFNTGVGSDEPVKIG